MNKLTLVLFLIVIAAPCSIAQEKSEAEIRSVVEHFQQALQHRDVNAIEPLVAKDIVVLENGHRNDGWLDFRDNHLIPEMKEPAPPSKTEVVKITASPVMGWAYTRTAMSLTRKNGEKSDAELWTVYIVEKRGTQWKITLLDWSMRLLKPATAK